MEKLTYVVSRINDRMFEMARLPVIRTGLDAEAAGRLITGPWFTGPYFGEALKQSPKNVSAFTNHRGGQMLRLRHGIDIPPDMGEDMVMLNAGTRIIVVSCVAPFHADTSEKAKFFGLPDEEQAKSWKFRFAMWETV